MSESNARNISLSERVDSLSVEELKSVFFLLQDCLKEDFLEIVKKDPSDLKEILKNNLYGEQFKESFFVELFGTIGRYDILRHLGKCNHVFQQTKNEFRSIEKLWKVLFEICEDIDDNDLKSLKEKYLDKKDWEHVNSAEEFFIFSFKLGLFSKQNFKALQECFSNKPNCLNIIKSYEDELNYYPMRKPTETSPCGIALIINHENFLNEDENVPYLEKRKGSKIDVEKLQKLWKCFGFEVRTYEDQSDKQVLDIVDEICYENHSSYDAFVMCYLSHGSEKTVFASNNKEIKIELLLNKIANETPTLNGKPKCFFIQACQGENIQTVSTQRPRPLDIRVAECTDAKPLDIERKVSELQPLNSPMYCDVYQVISTIPGYVSFRTPESGSWFVSAFYEIMTDLGDTCTITHIMTKVTDEVTRKRGVWKNIMICAQTPINSSTLCRELKFKKVEHSGQDIES